MKGIMKIVRPVPADGPVQFVATTLFATSEEIIQYYLSIEVVDDLIDTLSERECAIAYLIAKGKKDREIADELFINALSEKTHRSNIKKN